MAASISESERGRGDRKVFDKNIRIPGDYRNGPWVWTGKRTTNHNTTDGKKYTYGQFDLIDRNGNRAHPGHCAHRISIYVDTGVQIPDDYDVVSLVGDYLDINPEHLGVVSKSIRGDERLTSAVPARQFVMTLKAANDNKAARWQVAA